MSTELIQRPESNSELTVEQLVAQMDKLRDVMRRAMKEGEDFGSIPGTGGGKKPLLQPGAEKLAMMFRFAPSYTIVQTDLPNFHREFSVTCRLTHIPTGNFCGEATASCSSLEPKYRYRGGSLACPECGKSAIIKGKQEYGGGWVCFKKKGGCGAKYPDDQFSSAMLDKVENPDIAGEFNTIVQMAQKRAFLRAIRQATAASELFTQDIEEQPHDQYEAPQDHPPQPRAKPAAKKTEPPPACAEYETLATLLRTYGCRTPDAAKAVVNWAGAGVGDISELRQKPDECRQLTEALKDCGVDPGLVLSTALSSALNGELAKA